MKRNTTIDLLRIIAILFITTWHSFLFSSYGLRIDIRLQEMINENCFFTFGLCSVSIFLIIGVNLFLNGYHKSAVAILKNAKISWKLFSYNNILVMLFSICFFIAFLKIRIKEKATFEKAITLLYPSVFIIYVAQSCGFDFMKHFRSILIEYSANKFGLAFSTVFIIPNTVIVFSVLFIFYEIFNFWFKLLFFSYRIFHS